MNFPNLFTSPYVSLIHSLIIFDFDSFHESIYLPMFTVHLYLPAYLCYLVICYLASLMLSDRQLSATSSPRPSSLTAYAVTSLNSHNVVYWRSDGPIKGSLHQVGCPDRAPTPSLFTIAFKSPQAASCTILPSMLGQYQKEEVLA